MAASTIQGQELKDERFRYSKTLRLFRCSPADRAPWLSQLLFPASDSRLPRVLKAGKLLRSCGCQLCCWISRNMFAFLIKGTNRTGSSPSPASSCPEHCSDAWSRSSLLPAPRGKGQDDYQAAGSLTHSPSNSSYLLPDSLFGEKM